MRKWTADVAIDEELVRRLLAKIRGLEVTTLEWMAEGWDRSVWLANGEWVFGFPRQETAVAGVKREIATLSSLAAVLHVRIPLPVHVGDPTDSYPWPYFGWRRLPGEELGAVSLDDEARRGLAPELARFLRRLHSETVARAASGDRLPVDPSGRTDMRRRAPKALEYVDEVERLGLWQLPSALRRVLAGAERLPPPAAPTAIVHGDLHFRHVLVEAGGISGVIDWTNLCRADPAVDLQVVWGVVPPAARDDFLREYGSITPDQLLRARVLAVSLYAALALYGHAKQEGGVRSEAIRALEWVATD